MSRSVTSRSLQLVNVSPLLPLPVVELLLHSFKLALQRK
jgi:hypothetical protein